MKTGRNAPCPCGSGKKFKHCCLHRQAAAGALRDKLIAAVVILVLVGGAVATIATFRTHDGVGGPGPGLVWSEEHQHWH